MKFRNYKDSEFQERVEQTYKNMLENQTYEYVNEMKNKYVFNNNYKKYNIWKIIEKLEEIVDESDPDNDLPQIVHAHQTAESIKLKYVNKDGSLKKFNIKNLFTIEEWNNLPEKWKKIYNTNLNELYSDIKDWNWFPLIGFIHDLGKILTTKEFGNLPQWSVVGDTFPIGYKLESNVVFYEKNYHKDNKCLNENIYPLNCGLNKVTFSWGHDEYLASVLERNIKLNHCKLPEEGIYIIRYHSFYPWHNSKNKKGYVNLVNDYDWKMLPLLKAFQK